MSEPTSALSIEDLILRVAREVGVAYYGSSGQDIAMVPIDVHDLDLCKRIVNDGIRMFIASAPPSGWRWMRRKLSVTMTSTRETGTADSTSSATLVDLTLADTYTSDDDLKDWWIYITSGTGDGSYAQITGYTALTGTITVSDWLDSRGNADGTDPVTDDTYAITPVETVDGDIHRYPLPENFGGSADGPITYAADTNHSTIIDWVDESFIRQRRSITTTTGYPRHAAIAPLEPYASGAGPTRRFELLLEPEPTSSDTIVFPYSLYFDTTRFEAGSASGGSTITLVDSSLANLYPDDYFKGWVIRIINGTGKNSNAIVTGYAGTTGTFTVADWLFIDGSTSVAGAVDPDNTSIYVTQPVANLHPAGLRFDDIIESACLAKAEMKVDDLAGRGFVGNYRNVDLSEAMRIDAKVAPRSLGSMNKSGRGKRFEGGRIFEDRTFN